MTDASATTTVTDPAPAAVEPPTEAATAPPTPQSEAPPQPAAPEAPRSRAWLGFTALFVVVALLAGATAVLFVRVQEAQDRADEAVVIAGNQDVLAGRIDAVDASLASLETAGTATADDLAAARDQVGALRKCVNNALDSWAQAAQAGKAASITKC